MSKSHAIILSDFEATALEEGRKTQVRIPLRNQPMQDKNDPNVWRLRYRNFDTTNITRTIEECIYTGKIVSRRDETLPVEEFLMRKCPYSVGDTLRVCEAFAVVAFYYEEGNIYDWKEFRGKLGDKCPARHDVVVRRNWESIEIGDLKFRPASQMPKWSSRFELKVKNVRAERLNDISSEDTVAEGSEPGTFADFWDANKPSNWEDNPWVWALTFEATKTNRKIYDFEAQIV